MLKFFGNGDIKYLLKKYLISLNIKDKIVVDIPAGSGYTTEILCRQKALPEAYDLFPELFKYKSITCQKADLAQTLPIKDNHADLVICQEGIEHLQNQFFPLQEFNRILKMGGRLIITTPSISHIRAKLSHLFIESEIYNRLPANELDGVWFSKNDDLYFGHIFLIGIQKLRTLSKLAGFKITKIHSSKISNTALLLGLFVYPFILLINLYAYMVSIHRLKSVDLKIRRRTYREILKLNIHPAIQFGKHLFIEFEKIKNISTVNYKVYKAQNEIL